MSDPADRHLEDRLHALAHGVNVPVVPADDDVRRGRRRLLRIRLAMAGATAGTLAIVLGVTGLTAGDPSASEPPIANEPSTSLPVDPTTSASEEAESTGRQEGGGDTKVGAQAPPSSPSGSAETDGTDADTDRNNTGVAGSAGNVTTGDSEPHGGTTIGPGHAPSTESDPTSAPTSSAPTPTSTPTSTPTPTTDPTPTADPTTDPTVPPTDTTKVRVHQVLRYYNEVLAEQLDPDRDHLQPYNRKTGNKETTKRDGQLFALGSNYRWDGPDGLGGLEVTVASGWDQVDWECGASYTDWECHAPSAGGEVATHDGLLQAAVEHVDGQVVVLTADDVAADETALLEAAADDRLTLPGDAPVSPPTLDPEAFATAGVTALVAPDESFTRTSIDRTPEVRGSWSVADTARGTLSWSVRPAYSDAGWQCLKSYRSCTDLVIDSSGRVVHVAAVKKKLGGGWVVEYDGPAYAVRFTTTDQKFPRKRAYAFVTDVAWQPSR